MGNILSDRNVYLIMRRMAWCLVAGFAFAIGASSQEPPPPPPPQIFWPGDVALTNDRGRCHASGLILGIPKATDSTGGHTIDATRDDDKPISEPFPVGTTIITWTVTDAAGQTATTVQRIVVKDIEAPEIKAPPDVEAPADEEDLETSVDEGEPIIKDNCPDSVVITARRSDGREFRLSDEQHPRYPIGFTTVTWTATDPQLRQASASQQIEVKDRRPPQIEAPPDVVANTDKGTCAAFVIVGTATLAGKCWHCSIVPSRSDGKRRVDMAFPAGRTTIVWTATNASGVTATAEQEVVVNDTEGPVIGDVTVNTKELWPPNGRMVGVRLKYHATDACRGPLTTSLSVSSNEPHNAEIPDWDILSDHFVDLRAEITGSGERAYTISIKAVDPAGNQSVENVIVKVRPPE
jgi:hypothetical protein